jgi:ribosomal protein S18 acetylase RimI-like enzyme
MNPLEDVTVDLLAPRDWARYRAVRQRALRADPHTFAASAHRWLTDLDTPEAWRERLHAVRTLVVARGGADVATAGVTADGEVVGMWVDVAARGRGVGHLLVAALRARAGTPLHLRVMADNAAAIAFYGSCGFELDDEAPDQEGCRTMRLARPRPLADSAPS